MAVTYLTTAQRRASLLAVALLALAGLWTLRPFLPALGWGGVLTVSLWPWYQRRIAQWPRGRAWLPALVTLAVAVALILPLALVVGTAIQELIFASHYLAQASQVGIAPPGILAKLPLGQQLTAWWQANLAQPGGFAALTRAQGSGLHISNGERFAGAILRRLLITAFALLTLFFGLRDGDRLVAQLVRGSERAFGPAGERVSEQIVQAIRGTVNGLVVVGLGEGGVLGVVYAAAGVPHAVLFALLTALLSVVPLGASVAAYAAAAILVAQGAYGAAIAIAILATVVIFVADHFVRPVLIGGATRLPFLWVLLGILGGIESWGLIGLVLGPALIAALMRLWREWVGERPGPLGPAGAV